MQQQLNKPILVCYDGSEDAQAAVEFVSRLVPGRSVVVVSVWEPFLSLYTGYPGWPITDEEPMKANAERHAVEGCARARAGKLEATPLVVEADDGVARAILDTADDEDAELIVMGTRGLTGLRSLLLGSVTHDVAQHARRPVAIVPSQPLAEARTGAGSRR
jgi:nucleotide-binding universal stress UspA family protein